MHTKSPPRGIQGTSCEKRTPHPTHGRTESVKRAGQRGGGVLTIALDPSQKATTRKLVRHRDEGLCWSRWGILIIVLATVDCGQTMGQRAYPFDSDTTGGRGVQSDVTTRAVHTMLLLSQAHIHHRSPS